MARRHDVNANQVFYWRKLYREGRLGLGLATALLPVKVEATKSVSELATWIRYSPPAAGARPIEPWFEDLPENDDNDGGPETIN